MPRFLLAIAACLLAAAPAHSQEDSAAPAIERDLRSLTTIAEPIHAALADLETVLSELDALRNSLDDWQSRKLKTDSVLDRIDSYQGVPWKVSSIGFFTYFHNPLLHGGKLRIPIRHIMDLISRPSDPKEKWFPTEADDWVILSDGTFGKVISQSPEQVIVLLIGGSLKTYPTAEFLELHPENLSHGFRICQTFGIDYQHQAQSTTTIPETLAKSLTLAFISEFSRDTVRSIKVELSAAGASSLDYTILADFDGSLADKYKTIGRRIQSICVDACNQNGWVIPFTQITLHNSPQTNA